VALFCTDSKGLTAEAKGEISEPVQGARYAMVYLTEELRGITAPRSIDPRLTDKILDRGYQPNSNSDALVVELLSSYDFRHILRLQRIIPKREWVGDEQSHADLVIGPIRVKVKPVSGYV
jgi:hypothetical protein